MSGALSLFPFGAKESPNGTSLAMHPSVGFASQAKGYVNKERRLLRDAPLCQFSEKTSGCKKCSQGDFFVGEQDLFGRCHHQLILAALSLYPFGVKEGPQRRFLSDVPFGRFCLAMYPPADFAASGASWAFWVVWGLILACWDLRGWNMAFWVGFGASHAGILHSVASCA